MTLTFAEPLPKRKDEGSGWLVLLALIGGLYLIKEAFKPKPTYYRCWNCNQFILPNTSRCPRCGAEITWGPAF